MQNWIKKTFLMTLVGFSLVSGSDASAYMAYPTNPYHSGGYYYRTVTRTTTITPVHGFPYGGGFYGGGYPGYGYGSCFYSYCAQPYPMPFYGGYGFSRPWSVFVGVGPVQVGVSGWSRPRWY